MSFKELPREQQLEHIIEDTWWMARRYATNRSTYAATHYNLCMKAMLDSGIDIQPLDADGTVWAKDGMRGWPDDLIKEYGRHNAEVAERFDRT